MKYGIALGVAIFFFASLTTQAAETTLAISANSSADVIADQIALDLKVGKEARDAMRGQIAKYIELAKTTGKPSQVRLILEKGKGVGTRALYFVGLGLDVYDAMYIDLPAMDITDPTFTDKAIAVGGRLVEGSLLDAPIIGAQLYTTYWHNAGMYNDDRLSTIADHMKIDEARLRETDKNIRDLVNNGCIVLSRTKNGEEARIGPKAIAAYPYGGCNISINGKLTHTDTLPIITGKRQQGQEILTFFNDQIERRGTALRLLQKEQAAYNKRLAELRGRPTRTITAQTDTNLKNYLEKFGKTRPDEDPTKAKVITLGQIMLELKKGEVYTPPNYQEKLTAINQRIAELEALQKKLEDENKK